MSEPLRADVPPDHERLMHANLTEVFGERDASRRLAAIRAIYAPDAVLQEPQRTASGHAGINEAVTELLAGLPPAFAFDSLGPAMGHHGLGVLRWRFGPAGGTPAVTGMDVAQFRGGRIQTLTVFLMSPDSA